eukprot:1946798-Lingulodinium_polyedra.AAC.1
MHACALRTQHMYKTLAQLQGHLVHQALDHTGSTSGIIVPGPCPLQDNAQSIMQPVCGDGAAVGQLLTHYNITDPSPVGAGLMPARAARDTGQEAPDVLECQVLGELFALPSTAWLLRAPSGPVLCAPGSVWGITESGALP